MSCKKLCRQFLHLVLSKGNGLYSLRRMDISGLFYPSTAEAESAAEAKSKKKKKKNGINKLGVVGSLGRRLPGPCIHYQPFRSIMSDPYGWIDTFALFGSDKNKILCSDPAGHTNIYNTDSHSFMDMCPTKSCCFELLAYYPVGKWCWRPLPSPPFFDDPEYKPPEDIPFVVVNGTKICVSTTTATYCFDTVTQKWIKAGDWVLPFKAEYIPELGLYLGLSDKSPYELCTLDISAAVKYSHSGMMPPTARHVWQDLETPENWCLFNHFLVNLGSGRLCIAKIFDILMTRTSVTSIQWLSS